MHVCTFECMCDYYTMVYLCESDIGCTFVLQPPQSLQPSSFHHHVENISGFADDAELVAHTEDYMELIIGYCF